MNKSGYINVSGHRIFYQFLNLQLHSIDEPFIVFMHEGLGSVAQWKDFPDLLSKSLQLPALLYDRYGYGKSDPLERPRNIDFLHREALETLPEVLDKLEIPEPFILFGHSDGASISLIYASEYQKNLISMIIEATHVIIEETSMNGLQKAVYAFENEDMKEKLMKYHGDHTDSTFYGWADLWRSEKAIEWNILDLLPKIQTPIFFIQGEDDEYGTIKQLEVISQHVKGPVTSWFIPDCGHIPHLQYKEEVIAKLSDYISRITS